MYIFVLGLIPFFYLFMFSLHKKLIPLLSLEGMMVILISIFFFGMASNGLNGSFSLGMIFMILMVLDSVLGISLLIFCSRHSSLLSYLLV